MFIKRNPQCLISSCHLSLAIGSGVGFKSTLGVTDRRIEVNRKAFRAAYSMAAKRRKKTRLGNNCGATT
ncbi:unnamed protein product [Periconia digitata]|uniref:Uncharacterized protein n=1 Tax=Periconia digitata TaxID=1303443 RepID=A0A9W4XVC7_9PLEO|nr:unnamed protein product [Periconia digitata]